MPTTASARRSVADRYTLCQRHSGWRIPHFARTRTLGALPGCQHRPQSDAERTGKCERRSRFPVANGGMLVQPCQARSGIGSGTHPAPPLSPIVAGRDRIVEYPCFPRDSRCAEMGSFRRPARSRIPHRCQRCRAYPRTRSLFTTDSLWV